MEAILLPEIVNEPDNEILLKNHFEYLKEAAQ